MDSEQTYTRVFSAKGMTAITFAVIAILVVAVVYGGFQYFLLKLSGEGTFSLNVGLEEEMLTKSDVTGLIILSANKNESDVFQMQSYSLSPENDKLINESEGLNVFYSNFVDFEDKQNPNNLIFKAVTTVNDGAREVPVLYTLMSQLQDVVGGANVIATSPKQQFGIMDWSKKMQLIAYTEISDDKVTGRDGVLVSNWQVVVTDTTGNIKKTIEKATNPVWSYNSNKLLYVKSDGIYLYDFDLDEETLLVEVKLIPELNDNLTSLVMDITPDDQRLIVTYPTDSIEIYNLQLELPSASLAGRMYEAGVRYSWPIVSPDGKTYAVLKRTEDNENTKLIDPEINVFAINGRQVLYSYKLDGFDPATIMLDDWIVKK